MKTIFKNQTSKNIRFLALWILVAISFSCNKKLEIEFSPTEVQLELEPASVHFTATETETKTVMVSTNAAEWGFAIESSTEWLAVEKQGNTLRMNPKSANTGTTLRTANVVVSAKNATSVTVLVTQAAGGPPPVLFNMAEGKYFGDLSKTGNAQFLFYMYHSDEPRISVRIEGFCKLPPSFEEFKLDEGNYTCATSGAVRTFIPGSVEGLTISSSCYYDESISKLILANGGNFNVSLSGDTYTITTNMTGVDYPSGNATNIPRTTFTGKIIWGRYSLSVESSSINFGASEVGSQTATVITESPTWEFDPVSASWLTVQKQGNNQLRFTTNSANTSESKRETTVTVRANSAIPVQVKVTQNGTKDPEPGLIIPASTYTAATGTPTFFSTGPYTWTGEINPSLANKVYTITRLFNNQTFNIFANEKDGKIYLDHEKVIWEGGLIDEPGTFQAYLAYGTVYNGEKYSLIVNAPVEVYYNKTTNTLDFSNKTNVNFNGTIINNLTVYAGIIARPKPGTGAGTDSYWISDVYPDIKLSLTPKSGQSVRMEISDTPTEPAVPKKLITVDKSQLIPVNEMKTMNK